LSVFNKKRFLSFDTAATFISLEACATSLRTKHIEKVGFATEGLSFYDMTVLLLFRRLGQVVARDIVFVT
jgi:hypothetical protein